MVGLRGPKYLLFARKCLSEEIQKLLGFRERPRVGSEVGTISNFSNNGAGVALLELFFWSNLQMLKHLL